MISESKYKNRWNYIRNADRARGKDPKQRKFNDVNHHCWAVQINRTNPMVNAIRWKNGAINQIDDTSIHLILLCNFIMFRWNVSRFTRTRIYCFILSNVFTMLIPYLSPYKYVPTFRSQRETDKEKIMVSSEINANHSDFVCIHYIYLTMTSENCCSKRDQSNLKYKQEPWKFSTKSCCCRVFLVNFNEVLYGTRRLTSERTRNSMK